VSHGLVSDLGWQSLTQRRKNARLHLFYKGIHGLAAVPVDTFRRPIRTSGYSDGDTFTTLSSRVDSYTPFFLEPFQIGINCHCLFDQNQLLIRFVLLFSNFLDRSKNIAEP